MAVDMTTLHTFLLYVYPSVPLFEGHHLFLLQVTAQLHCVVLSYLALGTTSPDLTPLNSTHPSGGTCGKVASPFLTSFVTVS